jgi:hypothetical protein
MISIAATSSNRQSQLPIAEKENAPIYLLMLSRKDTGMQPISTE